MKYLKTYNKLFENNKDLSKEWTNDIVEYLQGYYGKVKNYNQLYSLIYEIVSIAVNTKSFNSFNDFLGYHNSKYWEKNKNENFINLWWSKLAYILGETDTIVKNDVDENFMIQIISVMDNVIEKRQENIQ